MTAIDNSVLLGYYQSRARATGGGAAAASRAAAKPPTPPWDVTPTRKPVQASELVRQALAGRSFVDERAAQLDVKGASDDYRKLFAAYGGLNMLSALAERVDARNLSDLERGQVQRRFAAGLKQVTDYVDALDLKALRLIDGTQTDRIKGQAFSTGRGEYLTQPIHTGGFSDPVAAFDGPVVFDVRIDRLSTTPTTVRMDLSALGSGSRSMADVVNYMNGQLQAAGVATRFANQRIVAEPRVSAGAQTPPGPDRYALKVVGGSGEGVSFSAPASAPSVYVVQSAGKADAKATADPTLRELLKFAADDVDGGDAPPPPVPRPGDAFAAQGRVFSGALGSEVAAVRASQTGADGSLYVLADVVGETSGQAIKGERDVALRKYDSAGALVWSRTLGAANSASGFALAVAADGKVAVAGSVTGGLVDGEIVGDPAKPDSFVTLFDAGGEEAWTRRNGALQEDEASALAFGADGTLYVAGRSRSAMPGAAHTGGWDGYLQALSTDATGKAARLTSVVGFGAADDQSISGVAVKDGAIVIAGMEGGHGVLRRFKVDAGAFVAEGYRDLGSLEGGRLAGVAFDGEAVVVAGSSRSGALDVGAVTRAHGGGVDAFVARFSDTLTPARIAYWGGAGDEQVSAMAVAGGKVWIAGSTAGEIDGVAAIGARDGFLTRLDDGAGAVGFTRRWSGKDGDVAPSTIAVAAGGASVLDRLGLPNGAIDFSASERVTAQTSARAGDQFNVAVNGGRPKTVTIEAGDTFRSLALKITRALGFNGSAAVKRDVLSGAGEDEVLGSTSRLQITSRTQDVRITIASGKGGRDALEALGLAEGEVRTLPIGVTETELREAGEVRTYGLGLSSDLTLTSKAEIKRSTDQLQAALGVIRGAYRDLKTAAQPPTPASLGQAPAYLTRQLANYQDALRRLGG